MARGLFIPARIDFEEAKRDAEAFKRIAKDAGSKSADELTKAFRAEYNRQSYQLREALAKGLIDKAQYRKEGQRLARDFNEGVLAALKELRKEGKATDADLQKLQRTLRQTATEGGKAGREGAKAFGVWKQAGGALLGVLGGIAAAISVRLVGRFFASSIREAEEAITVWTRLESAVENAGVSFGAVRGDLERAAGAAQRTTRFGDEEWASALAEVLTITNDLTTSTEHMADVLDLAAAKKIDLRTAAQLYGRALVGETGTLRRYGIVVQEGADAVQVMRERFKGAAERAAASLSGRLQRLRNDWSDLKEAVGKAILGSDSAADSIQTVSDKLVIMRDWVEQNAGALHGLAGGFAAAILKAGEFFAFIGQKLDPVSARVSELTTEFQRTGQLDDPDFLRAGLRVQGRDVQRLERERARIQAELAAAPIVDLQTVGMDVDESAARGAVSVRKLNKELEQTEAQLEAGQRMVAFFAKELIRLDTAAKGTGGGGGGAGGIDPDAIKEAERAASQLAKTLGQIRAEQEAAARLGVSELPDSLAKRLKEIVDLESRLNELRAQRAAAGALAPAGADALIEGEQAKLDRLRATFDALLADLDAKLDAIAPAVVQTVATVAPQILRQVEPAVTSIMDELAAVKDAQRELDQAFRTGDRERADRARTALQARRDALRESAAALAKGLEDSTLPAALVEKLLADISAVLDKAGIKASDLGEELSAGFEGASRGAELLLRGLLSVFDAMGDVGAETRRVLTGVLDLVAGMGQLKAASGGLATLGAVGAIAGAAIGIGAALSGGGEEERKRREAYAENLREVKRLTDDLARMADVVGPLTQAMRRATDALSGIGERLGLPGIRTQDDAVEERRRLIAARAELVAIREKVPDRDRGKITRLIGEVDDKILALTDALAAYDKQLAKLRENTLEDLRLRELQATSTTAVVEAEKLRLAQEAEIRDAIEAGLGDDVVARIREVQAIENEAREAALAARAREAQEDARVAQLESEGMTRTAAITRLLLEQERRLAELRKEGADAATLLAEAEAQAAAQRRQAEDLETSIRRRAAERSGDTATLRRLDEADLARQAADEIGALQKLFEAGLIPEDRLRDLIALIGDDLTAAIAGLGDAALEAARAAKEAAAAFSADLTEDLLRAQGRAEEADLLAAERRRQERIDRATELGNLDALADVIEQLFQLEAAKAKGLGAAGGEPSLRDAESELVRSITSIRSTEALTLADLSRSQLTELRRQTAYLAAIARQPINPADYAPATFGTKPAGGTSITSGDTVTHLTVNTTVQAQTGDANAIASLTSRRTVEAIDRALANRKFEARRGTGNPSLR